MNDWTQTEFHVFRKSDGSGRELVAYQQAPMLQDPTAPPAPPVAPRTVYYDSKALELAWQQLPGGPDLECPGCGERWQYMGSTLYPDGSADHSFRHRHHPATNRREYVQVPDSDQRTGPARTVTHAAAEVWTH